MTAYQPLLTTIKKEYEDTIEAIKKAQREATFLHGKLKAMASEPSTIRNYKKRADELEERYGILLHDDSGKIGAQEKTNDMGFQPVWTQIRLYSCRKWLEARSFGFKKKRDCTIHVAKMKVLITCGVTAPLFLHMQIVVFLV